MEQQDLLASVTIDQVKPQIPLSLLSRACEYLTRYRHKFRRVRSKLNDPSSVTWKKIPQFKSKQANMVQGSLKVYRLVIYFALSVSFVSGKINVTNNVIVLHRLFGVVFQFFAWDIPSEH